MSVSQTAPVITIALRLDASPTLLAALAELAGVARQFLGDRIAKLNVAISPPADGERVPATARGRSAGRAPAAKTQTPPARVKNGKWISEERDALIRELAVTTMRARDIGVRVNALPGPVASMSVIRTRWAHLGIRRPDELTPDWLRDRIASRLASETVPSAPVEAPPAAAIAPETTASAMAPDESEPAPSPAPEPSDTSLGARARFVPAAKPPALAPPRAATNDAEPKKSQVPVSAAALGAAEGGGGHGASRLAGAIAGGASSSRSRTDPRLLRRPPMGLRNIRRRRDQPTLRDGRSSWFRTDRSADAIARWRSSVNARGEAPC